ncbi:8487_t:CDS:2 [Funneliformis caledonium]|uniref:8487_t:CDS:1 n=1 Tax=Funneliformis caledonium TaxID=1117310 RepID=A0A9N8VI98_9GLOM|nr:8487_t:CDS:2 [Funneliformis caledonium]
MSNLFLTVRVSPLLPFRLLFEKNQRLHRFANVDHIEEGKSIPYNDN